MSKCVRKKQSSTGILKNQKYKLRARGGQFSIFVLDEVEDFKNHSSERPKEVVNSSGISNAMRYTNTHPYRKDTETEGCSLKSRQGETSSTERISTLSDKRKGTSSVGAQKVYYSQMAKSFA